MAWYYIKSGLVKDETFGPVSDQDLLQLAHDGQLKADTLVSHQKHTKGQWVHLSQIPAAKKRIDEGHQLRRQQKEEARAAKEQRKVEEAQARASSPIAQFLLEGQNESVVAGIHDRVGEILTTGEAVEYIAVQAKPVRIAPDAIVCTNRRFIVFRQKMLGQLSFDDYLWRDLRDARVKEGVMYSELTLHAVNGHAISTAYLPKAQARRIYRIAQEREEAATEERRQRMMEEQRAGASNVVVQTPTAAAEPPADDPVAKLTKLKAMLDAGLIEQEEYDATKGRILSEM